MKTDKNIDFVARHYRAGRFDIARGWRRLGIGAATRWRRYRIVAAMAALMVLSAGAAVYLYQHRSAAPAEVPAVATVEQPLATVKTIDFDNATLTEVIGRIKDVYGVEIADVPADADALRLSLHYEGNVVGLLDAINDILGTKMKVKQ